MDKETRDFLTEKFDSIDTKFEELGTKFDSVDKKFEGLQQHVDEKAIENRRHFEVVAEGLRSDIQQVAEGHQVLLDGQNRREACLLERVGEV